MPSIRIFLLQEISFGQRILDSFFKVFEQLAGASSQLLGALVIMLVGWILAKLLSSAIAKLLTKIGLDKLADRLNQTDTFQDNNINIKPVPIIRNFIYWTLMLIFILSATETLGFDIVTEQVGKLIEYIPKLFVSLIILVLGFYASDAIKGIVANTARSYGITAWKLISGVVFYILLIAIAITALNQAGINTDIITSNIYIILGGIVLAFAVAYGFAARNVLSSILTSFYTRGNYRLGQLMQIDEHKGRIIRIDNVSITLDTGDSHVIFPLNRLIDQKIILFPEDRLDLPPASQNP